MKVLGIGPGPVRLTAALALKSEGTACRIVETRDAPSEHSRFVGIMPETCGCGPWMSIVEERGRRRLGRPSEEQADDVEDRHHGNLDQ